MLLWDKIVEKVGQAILTDIYLTVLAYIHGQHEAEMHAFAKAAFSTDKKQRLAGNGFSIKAGSTNGC